MRHLNSGRKFDRDASSRKAMFKNLVANLLSHGEIQTTVAKAKEVRRIAERLITKAKRLGPIVSAEEISDKDSARRLAVKRDVAKFLPRFGERLENGETERLNLVEHLFQQVAPRFLTRPGGYTRILKTGNRRGDNAEMAILRFVDVSVAKSAAPEGVTAVRTEQPKSE